MTEKVETAWGSKEFERFLKKLGLPRSGEAMSLVLAIDFDMRRGDRAGALAAARDLAALDPQVDAETMADMAINEYERMDREFQNGTLADDDEETVPDYEDAGIQTDFTDEHYETTLRILDLPATVANMDMIRRVNAALEDNDKEKAKRIAKNMAVLMKADGGPAVIQAQDDGSGLRMDLDIDELVDRVIGITESTRDIAVNGNSGDLGMNDDAFHDTSNDPRYATDGTVTNMNEKAQEDAEAEA